MSRDEIERTMQFILHQQAQFAANMERTEVDLAKLAAQQGRFESHQERFESHQERIDATLERLSAKTDNIADGLIGLTGVVGQLTDSVSRLVTMFERHLRDNHGQRPL